MTAPTSGPSVVPAPPTITTSRNMIDCENVNPLGLTKLASGANTPPASPAASAERVNAMMRTAIGLSPRH